MILLVMLFILLVYLLLSVLLIYGSGKIAQWLGYNAKQIKQYIKILWFGPLIIWLVWDLPTIPLHKYYCSTQAGFFVYKTPEQWLKEHPEVTREELRTYSEYDPDQSFVLHAGTSKAKAITKLNRRIVQYLKVKKIPLWNFFPLGKRSEYIEDYITGEILAELISFRSGYKEPFVYGGVSGFKSWLSSTNCSPKDGKFRWMNRSNNNARFEYESYTNKFRMLGKQ